MTLFPEEIRGTPPLLFSRLQKRLLEKIRREVRNGICTERGLARRADLSQPHLHNVLKEVRTLSTSSADALLNAMSWSVLDLMIPPELEEPRAGVHLLAGEAGPAGVWTEEIDREQCVSVPCRSLAGLSSAAAVRVLPDAEMSVTAGIALVDRGAAARQALNGRSVYLVAKGKESRLRYIRAGRARFYLATAENLNRPYDWEVLNKDGEMVDVVLARLCPVPQHHLRVEAAFR